jgi:hypothetical protein
LPERRVATGFGALPFFLLLRQCSGQQPSCEGKRTDAEIIVALAGSAAVIFIAFEGFFRKPGNQ